MRISIISPSSVEYGLQPFFLPFFCIFETGVGILPQANLHCIHKGKGKGFQGVFAWRIVIPSTGILLSLDLRRWWHLFLSSVPSAIARSSPPPATSLYSCRPRKTKTGLAVACKCMIRNPKIKLKDKVLILYTWVSSSSQEGTTNSTQYRQAPTSDDVKSSDIWISALESSEKTHQPGNTSDGARGA